MCHQGLETQLTLSWLLLFEKPIGICFIILSLNPYLAKRISQGKHCSVMVSWTSFSLCFSTSVNDLLPAIMTCMHLLSSFSNQNKLCCYVSRKLNHVQDSMELETEHLYIHAIVCLYWTHMFRHTWKNRNKGK